MICVMLFVLVSACGGALFACGLTSPAMNALVGQLGANRPVDISNGYQGELHGTTVYYGVKTGLRAYDHSCPQVSLSSP
jgi:hypothetical protein